MSRCADQGWWRMSDQVQAARAHVEAGFSGFVGNKDAIYSIKRALIVALATAKPPEPPSLSRVFLLQGSPSTGKTEIARRTMATLGVPFIRLDGRGVKTREKLFAMIDEALLAQNLNPVRRPGDSATIPVFDYPAFGVFIDEVHMMSERTQEAFLTLLEADDRMMMLDGEGGRRRMASVKKTVWVFATTKPSDLDRAFRSRCIEISLSRYTVEEVAVMVRARYPDLPEEAVTTISACSRCVPRQAFTMAEEVAEELMLDGHADVRGCVRRVMNGRGVMFANGTTRDDLRYMELLYRERRPVGESLIEQVMHDLDGARISEDIEPFLLLKQYISITSKGRVITTAGQQFVRDARDILESSR